MRTDDKISQTLVLRNGRHLGFAEYGNENRKPLFYFHGNQGSRYEAEFIKDKIDSLNIHIISLDRPGMGLSDFQERRKMLDFPEDVLELAKHLSLERFSILGGSGGGPYALTCAYRIPPDQLERCIVVSGLGPYSLSKKGMVRRSKNQLIIAKYFPWSIHFLIWASMGRKVGDEEWWETNYNKLLDMLPEPDRKVSLDTEIKKRMIKKTIEAFRQGSKGPAHDFKLFAKPWGFTLEEIPVETKVSLFHGEMDINVPLTMAQTMNEQILNSELKIYPEEGHLSVLVNRFKEMWDKSGVKQ